MIEDVSEHVWFEECVSGGVELVFSDELLETVGVSAGDEVEFRVMEEEGNVWFEIDFGGDDGVAEIEERVSEFVREEQEQFDL